MGKLIYLITTSIDGYVADKNGDFGWTAPSEESHAFVNDIVRNTGTFLFGRNMYETMKVWDDIPSESNEVTADFARIWHGANKIIYSTSLKEVSTANTTIDRFFNPAAMQKLVTESDKDFGIGGPNLAARAIKANSIDEYHQFIAPVIIGSGNHWLPEDIKSELILVDVRKFANGFAYLKYSKT